jgi:hypothetical protein
MSTKEVLVGSKEDANKVNACCVSWANWALIIGKSAKTSGIKASRI